MKTPSKTYPEQSKKQIAAGQKFKYYTSMTGHKIIGRKSSKVIAQAKGE